MLNGVWTRNPAMYATERHLVTRSIPPRLRYWSTAALDNLPSVTEPFRSPLPVYGTVCLQSFYSATVNLVLRDIWRQFFLIAVFIQPDWFVLQRLYSIAYGALQVKEPHSEKVRLLRVDNRKRTNLATCFQPTTFPEKCIRTSIWVNSGRLPSSRVCRSSSSAKIVRIYVQ